MRQRREKGLKSWALVSFASGSEANAALAGAPTIDTPSGDPLVVKKFDMKQAIKSDGKMRQLAEAHSNKMYDD